MRVLGKARSQEEKAGNEYQILERLQASRNSRCRTGKHVMPARVRTASDQTPPGETRF